MQRFYFKYLEPEDEVITVKNTHLLNQLSKVIRAWVGQEFIFFNGIDSIDYIFELRELEKREAIFVKTGNIEKDIFPNRVINIVQALPNKREKIEFLLQKGTEVGISNFLFFRSERSQKLNISENKLDRLKKIVIEAVEQSGRNDVPEIFFIDDINLNDFIGQNNIIFHIEAKGAYKISDTPIDTEKNINFFIGPEGGFSKKEVKLFEDKNFTKVYLGNTILRAETVGIVAGFYFMQN